MGHMSKLLLPAQSLVRSELPEYFSFFFPHRISWPMQPVAIFYPYLWFYIYHDFQFLPIIIQQMTMELTNIS